MELKAFRAQVEGVVQGVGFRYSTLRQAQRLGLKGYVRNLPNGTVEVLAEGESKAIERLQAWLKQGPPGAYVRNLAVRRVPYAGTYRSFGISY